jgi:hypothetical protein
MSLYDPGSDPDLGLPALRAFMTWALPGLDSGSREGLLRSAAASGEAAYLDNGIAPPPWITVLQSGHPAIGGGYRR